MVRSSPFWAKDGHTARQIALRGRAATASAIRRWFHIQGFEEVDPAALQISPGNETHLHGFRTELVRPDGETRDLWLHTSPEFAMKKLLAAGERKIFALTHVFRNRERTALHAPEFAMLEWYRVGSSLEQVMEDCSTLMSIAGHVTGAKAFRWRGREASPFEPPERLTVRDAYLRYAGIDLFESVALDGVGNAAILAAQAAAAGVRVVYEDTWSDVFSRILSERIEPKLGVGRATILYDYPASEAALSRAHPDDPRLAERFELYCCAVELANAFHELTDAAEQRNRFEADMSEQARIYGASAPIDEDFLNALPHVPDACGAALGFDRLVMLATGGGQRRGDPVDSHARPSDRTRRMNAASPAMDKARATLASVFGFSSFRPGQEEVLYAAFEGRDVLAVMPTGSGKSLCFQLPAIVRQNLTLVVSPLIALMRDQVAQMQQFGVEAASLNSASEPEERRRIKRGLDDRSLRLLYIAPERLMSGGTLEALKGAGIGSIAIDEAHCVSQWGHDFRPEYLRLREVVDALGGVQTIAVTATADAPTRAEIESKLFRRPPKVFVRSFDRPNLFLAMRPKTNATRQLLDRLSPHSSESGIIYCASRKRTEELAEELRRAGRNALPYHAGLDHAVRHRKPRDFSEGGRLCDLRDTRLRYGH